MKKLFILGSLAAFGMLAMTSCSNEEDMPVASGDGVSFTVRVPGHIQSRGTFGDGTDAGDRAVLNNLQWTVFEVSGDEANPTLTKVFSDEKAAFSASQTEETVSINLAKGKKYQVAFYADDSTNGFVTFTDGEISVDYTQAASNTAAEDAFIGSSDVFTVEGAFSKIVTLTRPFAQLNWGTDDKDEKSIAPLTGSLTGTVSVKQGLFSKMNVISGEVSEAVATATTFAAVAFNALPTQAFPVAKTDASATPYALIAMNYLLTGNGTIDCELAFNNGLDPVTVSAAPVKVNYRTNIFGSLLTSPGSFNIRVDNNFINPDNDINTATFVNSQADFESALANGDEKIVLNPGEYVLKTPATDGVTIIGNSKESTVLKAPASVYFENKGITLQNLTYTVPTGLAYTESTFGFLQRIQNLTIKDCIINGSLRINVNNGGVANIENCVFNVSTANGFDGYALFYYAATGSTVNVKDCQFNTVSKGIVMYCEGPTVYNLNVDKCTFTASVTDDKAAIQMHTETGISGDLHINNCTATGFADVNGGLWNDINNITNTTTQKFNVWVDGVQVQTAE